MAATLINDWYCVNGWASESTLQQRQHNGRKMYDYFQRLGWPHYTICAMMGNFSYEDGSAGLSDAGFVNPGVVEGIADVNSWYTRADGTRRKRGAGFAQWTPFSKAAARIGMSEAENGRALLNDGDSQCAVVVYDFAAGDGVQWLKSRWNGYTLEKFLSGDDTLDNLTRAFHVCYEFSSGINDSSGRQLFAHRWDEFFGGVNNPNNPNPPNQPPEPTPDGLTISTSAYPPFGNIGDYYTFSATAYGGTPPYQISGVVMVGGVPVASGGSDYISTPINQGGRAYGAFQVRDAAGAYFAVNTLNCYVGPPYNVMSAYVNISAYANGSQSEITYMNAFASFLPPGSVTTPGYGTASFAWLINGAAVYSGTLQPDYKSNDGYTDMIQFSLTNYNAPKGPLPARASGWISINTTFGPLLLETGDTVLNLPGQSYSAVNGTVTLDNTTGTAGAYVRATLTMQEANVKNVVYRVVTPDGAGAWLAASTSSDGITYFSPATALPNAGSYYFEFRVQGNVDGVYYYFKSGTIYIRDEPNTPGGGGLDLGNLGTLGSALWLKVIKQKMRGERWLPNA